MLHCRALNRKLTIRSLRPTLDPWSQARTRATEIVLDMLGAMLDNDTQKLEKLILENMNHINDPVGMPFDTPNSRFFGHPALNQMVILQHPDQTLFDIACGLPCGPHIWVMLSHGATGSRHPLGTDLALHNAIKNGRAYTVQALLLPGRSNVNGVPGTTWKPLLQAVFWNVPDVVCILMRKGANINDVGPSPYSAGSHTALQLCLEYRLENYINQPSKEKCHKILKLLLDADAELHVVPQDGHIQCPFELFIKPWQGVPLWFTALSEQELDFLRHFCSKGTYLHAQFDSYPCSAPRRHNFEHQVLWHSTPELARLLIDNFVKSKYNDGSSLLHDLIGSCPDAKRHPADTLRDIEVLLQKGVDPNHADVHGITPLINCLKLCPAVDLVTRLQMLLDAGADPELPDDSGTLPYILAARTFEEPLLSEVMERLVSKIQGRYSNCTDGITNIWTGGHFPISEDQTYERVMSCTRPSSDFTLNMRKMIPHDIQEAFHRAYFGVISKNFLDTMTKLAKSKMLDSKEKNEIVWMISSRSTFDFPDYKFDQGLIVALFDAPLSTDMIMDTSVDFTARSTAPDGRPIDTTASTATSPVSSATVTTSAALSPTHVPFQFNSNGSPSTDASSVAPRSPKRTAAADQDFFIPPTTQIRWRDPTVKRVPGDVARAVLEYECMVCGGGTLLTLAEFETHGKEHAHTAICETGTCARRFCADKKKKNDGCQDHLFTGSV